MGIMGKAVHEIRRIILVKVLIKNIKITDRVRKDVTKIDELVTDIQLNGLINPITVMSVGDDEYRLLAGLRRLRAFESMGLIDIDVNIVSPANAEAQLRIEISENEQRVPFTFSEKMDFARLLEVIEKEKAKKRQVDGASSGGKIAGNGRSKESSFPPPVAEGKNNETREIVAKKIGMGKTSYDCAKYIADNAPEEIIKELDKGQRNIKRTYNELRSEEEAKEKSSQPIKDNIPKKSEPEVMEELSSDENGIETINSVMESKTEESNSNEKDVKTAKSIETPKTSAIPNMAGLLSKEDEASIQRNREFNAMPPLEKVKELQRQLKEERSRATHAESELSNLKEFHRNTVYHKDGIITNLAERLAEAEARIRELESKYCPNNGI